MKKSEKKPFIDSNFAKWLMLFIAIVGLAWGFYGNYHLKSPRLVYEIQSRAVLFNETEDLSSVRLYMDSLEVLSSEQNISVYTFKVCNKGSQHLTGFDYDEGAFGIRLFDGTILKEATFGEASNKHILERYQDLSPVTSAEFVEIPRISLDIEDWYTFSIAVLHTYGADPKFEAVGKIIGQKEIDILTASSENLSFWDRIFYGSILDNIVRFLVCFIICALVMLLISLIAFAVGTSETISKEEEAIMKDIALDPDIHTLVRDDYLKNEEDNIAIAIHYFGLGEKRLNVVYSEAKEYIFDVNNIDTDSYERYLTIYREVSNLVKIGYLSMDGNETLTIPLEVKESVNKVVAVFKKYNYKPYATRRYPLTDEKRMYLYNDFNAEDKKQ